MTRCECIINVYGDSPMRSDWDVAAKTSVYKLHKQGSLHIIKVPPTARTAAPRRPAIIVEPLAGFAARAALGVVLEDGADALGLLEEDREVEPDEEDGAEEVGNERVTLVLARAQNLCASCSAVAVSDAHLVDAQEYMWSAKRVLLLATGHISE